MTRKSHGTLYTFGFAAIMCLVCALIVSTTAVSLHDRQVENQHRARLRHVLTVADVIDSDERPTVEHIEHLLATKVRPRIVRLDSGRTEDRLQASDLMDRSMAFDPDDATSISAGRAGHVSVPRKAVVYDVMQDGELDSIIIPIHGRGLWSTLRGFLALEADGTTVRGITFYQHAETPGLGGEIDAPSWKAQWKGRRLYDGSNTVKLEVVKGSAGPPEQDPHRVDAISGATITSMAVSDLVQFWAGPRGFGPFLRGLSETRERS